MSTQPNRTIPELRLSAAQWARLLNRDRSRVSRWLRLADLDAKNGVSLRQLLIALNRPSRRHGSGGYYPDTALDGLCREWRNEAEDAENSPMGENTEPEEDGENVPIGTKSPMGDKPA